MAAPTRRSGNGASILVSVAYSVALGRSALPGWPNPASVVGARNCEELSLLTEGGVAFWDSSRKSIFSFIYLFVNHRCPLLRKRLTKKGKKLARSTPKLGKRSCKCGFTQNTRLGDLQRVFNGTLAV